MVYELPESRADVVEACSGPVPLQGFVDRAALAVDRPSLDRSTFVAIGFLDFDRNKWLA